MRSCLKNRLFLLSACAAALFPFSVRAEEAVAAPSSATSLIVPLAPPDAWVSPGSAGEDFTYEEDDASAPQVSLVFRSMLESNGTSGQGRASSVLEAGEHFMNELDVFASAPVGDGWTGSFKTLLRHTDSRSKDPETLSIQSLQATVSNPLNHVTVGDYYASFSQFSLNRSIKGIGYQRNFGQDSYLRLVAGSFAPRWEHVIDDSLDRPVERHVFGARGQVAGESYKIGFNLVAPRDRGDDPARTTEDVYHQVLPSFDWEYRKDGISLNGEHAYASTTRDEAAGTTRNLDGTANRINASASLGALRLRGRFEHVTPDFYTMGGGATSDRSRLSFRGDWKIDKTWAPFLAYEWYRNNLSGQLAATTRTYVPEIGVRASGLFDRRSLTASTSLRRRVQETRSAPVRRSRSDRLNLSLGDRFGEFSVNAEMEALLNKDVSPGLSKNEDMLYRLNMDSRHRLMEDTLDVRPSLTLEHQDAEDKASGEPVRTTSARFNLRIIPEGSTTFGMNMERTIMQNHIAGSDDSRTSRVALEMENTPDFLSGGSIRTEAGLGAYHFTDETRNYRENYLRVSLEFPFYPGKGNSP